VKEGRVSERLLESSPEENLWPISGAKGIFTLFPLIFFENFEFFNEIGNF